MPDTMVAPLPKKINVLGMIALTVVTLGVYHAWWALQRSRELNAIGPEEHVGMSAVVVLLAIAISYVPLTFVDMPQINRTLLLMNVAYLFVGFWVALGMRRKLNVMGGQASLLPLAVFGFFYVQHVINRMHATRGPDGAFSQSVAS